MSHHGARRNARERDREVQAPEKSLTDFWNVVNGYETTFGKSTRRDNRTTFSSVVDTALKAEIINPHVLKMEFDISRDQVKLIRDNRSANLSKETRDALMTRMKARATEMAAEM